MYKMFICMSALLLSTQFGLEADAQFQFRFVQSNTNSQVLNNNDALEELLGGANVAFEEIRTADVFDLVDADDAVGGLFGFDLDVLGQPGVSDDAFGIEVLGEIEINNPGIHTFGINLDDGGRIEIDTGNGLETVVERFDGGATDDFYGQINFDTVGRFPIRVIFREGPGQGNIEAFSAFGSFSQFDSSFRLLGDTENGGLNLITVPEPSIVGLGLVLTMLVPMRRHRRAA